MPYTTAMKKLLATDLHSDDLRVGGERGGDVRRRKEQIGEVAQGRGIICGRGSRTISTSGT